MSITCSEFGVRCTCQAVHQQQQPPQRFSVPCSRQMATAGLQSSGLSIYAANLIRALAVSHTHTVCMCVFLIGESFVDSLKGAIPAHTHIHQKTILKILKHFKQQPSPLKKLENHPW